MAYRPRVFTLWPVTHRFSISALQEGAQGILVFVPAGARLQLTQSPCSQRQGLGKGIEGCPKIQNVVNIPFCFPSDRVQQ